MSRSLKGWELTTSGYQVMFTVPFFSDKGKPRHVYNNSSSEQMHCAKYNDNEPYPLSTNETEPTLPIEFGRRSREKWDPTFSASLHLLLPRYTSPLTSPNPADSRHEKHHYILMSHPLADTVQSPKRTQGLRKVNSTHTWLTLNAMTYLSGRAQLEY